MEGQELSPAARGSGADPLLDLLHRVARRRDLDRWLRHLTDAGAVAASTLLALQLLSLVAPLSPALRWGLPGLLFLVLLASYSARTLPTSRAAAARLADRSAGLADELLTAVEASERKVAADDAEAQAWLGLQRRRAAQTAARLDARRIAPVRTPPFLPHLAAVLVAAVLLLAVSPRLRQSAALSGAAQTLTAWAAVAGSDLPAPGELEPGGPEPERIDLDRRLLMPDALAGSPIELALERLQIDGELAGEATSGAAGELDGASEAAVAAEYDLDSDSQSGDAFASPGSDGSGDNDGEGSNSGDEGADGQSDLEQEGGADDPSSDGGTAEGSGEDGEGQRQGRSAADSQAGSSDDAGEPGAAEGPLGGDQQAGSAEGAQQREGREGPAGSATGPQSGASEPLGPQPTELADVLDLELEMRALIATRPEAELEEPSFVPSRRQEAQTVARQQPGTAARGSDERARDRPPVPWPLRDLMKRYFLAMSRESDKPGGRSR